MEIVKLSRADMSDAADLVWTVFDEFEGPDYSPEGVEEFRRSINCVTLTEMVENGDMRLWGCIVQGQLAGLIALRGKDHISLLFVRRENHRKGMARQLFNTVLEECPKENNITRITVNSSPYAVEVYHRLGFKDTNTEQIVNGIRFTPMEYVIPDESR